MKSIASFLITILIVFVSHPALAQIDPTSEVVISPEVVMEVLDETIELPPMEVLGEKPELALRMVKSALDRGRVYSHEGHDQLHCWHDRGKGSHLIYLYCALGKTLEAAAITGRTFRLSDGEPNPHVYRSRFPVNPLQMEKRLNGLGPTAVNDEIVAQALRGAPMPVNVPTQAEIDRFAAALREIKAIRAALESQGDDNAETGASLLAAIEEHGLTVERYNDISELVERYSSLRRMVNERI